MKGVTFGTKHSYNDFGLFLRTRPVISPPEPKTNIVDIPGADGSLDLSTALTGYIMYEMRKIKCEFLVIDGRNRWPIVYSEVMNYLHGQYMRIVFDDDPEYYYEGMVNVNSWKSSKKTSTIVIEATVKPYKMEVQTTADEWEWNPFNFETDVITPALSNIEIDGEQTITLTNCGQKRQILVVDVTNADNLTVTNNGTTYQLQEGANRINGIRVYGTSCTLVFNGSGTVTIAHRGGSL